MKRKENKNFLTEYSNEEYICSHDRRKKVSLREHGEKSIYILSNPAEKEIAVYRIDHGLISSESVPKCDFAIYVEGDLLILVELKGADYEHALEQIESTIRQLIVTPNINVSILNARIVLSKARVPNMLITKEKKLQAYLKRYFHGNLVKKTLRLEESI